LLGSITSCCAGLTPRAQFYLDVLGLSFETRQDKLVQLRAGKALIDIVRAEYAGPAGSPSSTGANLDHLCLRVEPFDAAAIARPARAVRPLDEGFRCRPTSGQKKSPTCSAR
jgi:glyoxylase I family protein